MKRKLGECDRAEGVACRDWLKDAFPALFPSFMEVYIAIQPTFNPPSIPGVHCIYLMEPLNLECVRSYVTARQSVQFVVQKPAEALSILQFLCPTFNIKSLQLDEYL